MLERLVFGDVPAKHHLALRAGGRLRYEECLTRKGFDGPYTIAYHEHRPQALRAVGAPLVEPLEAAPRASSATGELARRHFRTLQLEPGRQAPWTSPRCNPSLGAARRCRAATRRSTCYSSAMNGYL